MEIIFLLQISNFGGKDEGKYYCFVFNEISEVYTQRSYVMVSVNNYLIYKLSFPLTFKNHYLIEFFKNFRILKF